ncbi:hypothetical protein HDU93_002439 [Gonapodya sp. JEL0774]|nr:hypothetical protein HDU93_002439 [Gonapodya sp. JEL0774]
MTTEVKSTDILKLLKVLMPANGGIADYKRWRSGTELVLCLHELEDHVLGYKMPSGQPVDIMKIPSIAGGASGTGGLVKLRIPQMDNAVKVGTTMDVWKWMEQTYMVVSVAAKQNTMKEWNSVMATGETTDKYDQEFWMKYKEYKAMGGEPDAGTISLVYLEGIQDAYLPIYSKYAFNATIGLNHVKTAMRIHKNKVKRHASANLATKAPGMKANPSVCNPTIKCWNCGYLGHIAT